MPGRLSKSALVDRVVQSIRSCGWNPIILESKHPAKLVALRNDHRFLIRVYIWNLTHGGTPRDPNELRIQVTGVNRFLEEAGTKTLVLGWSESEEVFTGFDVTRHRIDMHDRSPSLQVRLESARAAKEEGFFPHERNNREIAIVFRPDFFMTYVSELEALHRSAGRSRDLRALRSIAASPVEQVVPIPPGPRRVVLQEVERKVRDARFRRNIIAVYQNRCAFSGIQLGLLDAAHIVPVEHEQGTDETKNGICVTPLHHRAFDRALIGIRSDYSIVLNEARLGELRTIGWDGGIEVFRSTLRDHINLPHREDHYPDPEYLVLGQVLRGWTKRVLTAD